MPAFGKYPIADAQDPGEEISSGNEGRVLGITESDLVHPDHTDGFVNIGDPAVIGVAAVGVALIDSESDSKAISMDSEGIFNLDVLADDDDGNSAVAGGDLIYINKTDGVLSKISNTVTNIPFGYALGIVGAGLTEAIAVKVHFDPALLGGTDQKGLDHVQGTTDDPIAWGVLGEHVKSNVFTVGVLTDYINYERIHMLTTDDITAGGVYNIYSRQDIKHDIQNMIGIHALGYVTPAVAADLSINQILGISGQVYVNNPGKTITLSDQIAAVRATMDQDATSAITASVPGRNGRVIGFSCYMNGLEHDNGGDSIGMLISQGGGGTSYPDYGIYVEMESANALAGIKIVQLAVDGGYGIDFEDSGGFYSTALIRYNGVNAHGYFLTLTAASGAEDTTIPFDTATCDQTADKRLRVRCEGDSADRYIYLYPI